MRGLKVLEKALEEDENLEEFLENIEENFGAIEELVKDVNYNVSIESLALLSNLIWFHY